MTLLSVRFLTMILNLAKSSRSNLLFMADFMDFNIVLCKVLL